MKTKKEKILKRNNKKFHISPLTSHHSNGITLVALIITIIVLLILAVVAIRAVTGDGILAHAKNARDKWEEAQRNEEIALDQLTDSLKGQTTTGYNEEKKVNAPELKTGMVPVKYDTDHWVVTTEDDKEWYDYTAEKKQWANVMLRDGLKVEGLDDASTASIDSMKGKTVSKEGSMFVWIPRFAYKITSLPESAYKEENVSGENTIRVTDKAGTIDIVFLQGTTDYYGNKKAIRANKATEEYVVHPSFTNDVNLGGWDRELTGYWVAKFEAGYSGEAGKPDSAEDSGLKYTRNYSWNDKATYIKDNYYGQNQIADSELIGENAKGKAIKYPTFTGNRPSFNYISAGDSYSLCLSLNASGNPYGINNSSDPHLMKNSEWGAVAYLGQSQYGKGSEITINADTTKSDDTSQNTQRTVWATTGGGDYKSNTTQSSTNNIYGIYDLSGGLWEIVASYVNNENKYIADYGASMKVGNSTKYVTVYQQGTTDERVSNYVTNKEFYGDAVIETSSYDENRTEGNFNYYTSWFHDYSVFPAEANPFFVRGGYYGEGNPELTGSFAFIHYGGYMIKSYGFRAVLV